MIRLIVFLAVLISATPAFAHTRSQSASHWRIDGDLVRGRIEADALDATRLYALGGNQPLPETFAVHAGDAFDLSTTAGACRREGEPHPAKAPQSRVAVDMVFRCPTGALSAGRLTLASRLFFDVAPSHLHFAAVSAGDDREMEAVLTDARRRADIVLEGEGRSGSAWAAFTAFVPFGAVHVWGGLDHLAFILALVLLARGLWRIALAASGFTLGHTATLLLASLGVVQPDAAAVEALIGFTVAFVAIEAARDGEARMARWSAPIALLLLALAGGSLILNWAMAPLVLVGLAVFTFCYPRGFARGASAAPWLAAVFGLVHGCGFAGAIGELDLPRPRLLSALAGFNVGVELAQIAVIVAALSLAWIGRRRLGARSPALGDAIAAGLVGVGVFWFTSRTLGV